MKLLLVSQYFWPESFRINEVAASLAARGVETVILTGKPNYPDGKIFSGYRAWGCAEEACGKVRILRVPMFPRGSRSALRLALNYLSFIVSGTIFGPWLLRGFRPGAILVYCPSPLLQALPALLIGWLKRTPVIVYVQDLWPESLEATGHVRSRWILRGVGKVVGFIYRHADVILISSQPFAGPISRFAPNARIVYYPNSVDASFCDPEAGTKTDLPVLDGGFSVVFAGNIGSAQAVEVIVEAAALLADHSGIRLVILGSGSELEWMRQQVRERKLANLYLAGRFPVEAMPSLLARASALLVTLADRPIFAATVPNKIQAYMAVGRPIVACLNGEGARLVEEAEAGVAVPAEDAHGLADAILKLHRMSPQERDRLGENGRAYYRAHFDHEKLVSELIGHVREAMGDNA
ncbi:MAG: glycosyltransferase family 4 protein [Candidatus Nitricoxidivorans perseverans]|uniref:Glycosyltransferase family 4 protein n=1 Tax=Candidatus Nitricoxidivorans perseverans TaxID=2975601 RepID=A0AA49FK15_9PROT|nr:MAG: glycosyltransferase family 4 protein [Candidatus Nitricoxidivorans perseverans]